MEFIQLPVNYFLLFCKVALTAIFLVAGIAKLVDLSGTRKAIADFGFPENLARPLSLILPVVELIIVVFLLSPDVMWYGALGALILLLIFTILMLAQLARGAAPDCHCFGQLYSQAVGPKSVIKNILMMAPAVILLITVHRASLEFLYEWLNRSIELTGIAMYFLFGATIIILLAVIIFYLKRIADEQRIVNGHLDEMIVRNADAGASHQHHEHMTAPDEGLPIGATVPDFALPDMQGKEVTFEQLLMRGRPLLFFFMSPTCAPCKSLLPEIGKWQEELAGKVDFIFFSTGSVEENATKLARLGGQIHLLQKKREVADLFKAKWTPTAVLVNTDGLIASRLAPGDALLKDLIDAIKEKIDNLNYVENGRGMSPGELKIGVELPEFKLPDTTGKNVTDELIRGKKTLALFWGLDCPHCQRMLPEIKAWEKAPANDVQLVIFSSGDAEKNRALDMRSPVVLDDDGKVGSELGMFGTPSAVLIDEAGKIVSETAVGSEQIWSLVGKRK